MRTTSHHLLIALIFVLSPGCAAVSIRGEANKYAVVQSQQERHKRDALSFDTQALLSAVGKTPSQCLSDIDKCDTALREVAELSGDQIHASLAEIHLAHALRNPCSDTDIICGDRRALELIDSARQAYLYFFFGDQDTAFRLFDHRQLQVVDFYNRAVEELVWFLYSKNKEKPAVLSGEEFFTGMLLDVNISKGISLQPPQELAPARKLNFKRLRKIYRNDGLGAEFVAIRSNKNQKESYFHQLDYYPVTMTLSFAGRSSAEIEGVRSATLNIFDAHQSQQTQMGGHQVPLAANFSAAYGLWLERTNLASVGMSGLFGRKNGAEDKPKVILLEPYDPNRRVLILIHGLASSQQAWINVANEVTGDATLRRSMQIWQVVYPTKMPILASRAQIDKAIRETFRHFDPSANDKASHGAILVGHSMGGVIARLLVTSSDLNLINRLTSPDIEITSSRRAKLLEDSTLHDLMQWSALPQIGRVVFIAAPHRGTPIAQQRIGRTLARVVKLPQDVVRAFKITLKSSNIDLSERKRLGLPRPQNGVDDLAEKSRVMLAINGIPNVSEIPFHSIIARKEPRVSLESSSDGLVPYASAHLTNAVSEKVITGGHSIQETPEAILELRRILHDAD